MSAFVDFILTFNKTYTTAREYFNRALIFEKNLAYINWHNTAGKPYMLAVNEYADLSWEEFKKMYVGAVPQVGRVSKKRAPRPSSKILPESVDWRVTGKVNAIKNQESCGSCWAFSAISTIETNYAITNGTLLSLSEQQLVDCSRAEGNFGCNGGLMDNAFAYAEHSPICLETEYPYTASDGQCKLCEGRVRVHSFVDVPSSDEEAMKEAVSRGSISVAIEADKMDFQFYSSGVFRNEKCGTNLDHGVVVVGYGTDSSGGGDYWIVRNSWGSYWGEQGYIRLARGVNQCGVALMPSYPVVA